MEAVRAKGKWKYPDLRYKSPKKLTYCLEKTQETQAAPRPSSAVDNQNTPNKKIVPKPFWNKDSARISRTLWLPSHDLIEREWAGEPVTEGWGTCVRKFASDPSITGSLLASTVECRTDDENERARKRTKTDNKHEHKEQAEKVRRFRLYPTKEQKAILRNWFGTARWTYNQCLDAVEKKEVARTKKDLRAAFLNKEAIDKMGKPCILTPWVLETPYDIRDAAMADLLKAYDSAFARHKIW
ncbi:hypothetical protein V1525DRAFT_350735 [Lipomyces kononenkoae]|uniref:Uncharacterized protein n=1 Tax=Lipomyces kononenkoae TaxID=34357 RepID=A0ACC3SRB1_LIPKO